MKSIQAKVIDALGLHARPASKITTEATKYKCDVKLICEGREANAKSLINLMALGVRANSKIEIQTKGLDEADAIAAIEKVMRLNKII